MALRLFKYTLVNDLSYMLRQGKFIDIELPVIHTILDVQKQYDNIVMWAVVDDERELITKRFYIYGTGATLNEYHKHIKSIISGSLVFHIFE